jgi:hypothetical protein
VATDAGVELSWQIGEGSDPPLAIERSTGGFSWSAIAPAGIDGGGRVDFTDSAAPNANRIGYRLAFASSHEGEVWVDVPARSPFAIRSIGPNPATNRVLLALSLSEHRAARIDVVDLAGRRVLSHDLGVLEAGSRQVSLDGLGALPAGLYLVRLTAGAQVATSRLMVVR